MVEERTVDPGEFSSLITAEVVSEPVRREMTGGHDRLIRLALAHAGCLP